MQIKNSDLNDMARIFELYRNATAYMKSKNQVFWPEFSRELIDKEIKEKRQWKIVIDGQIACIWATTLNDELIWGKKNSDHSLYIHRIATSPAFRGLYLVKNIINWADEYCIINNLKFVRMDTIGFNKGLIKHYKKFGFDLLGTKKLKTTKGLPDHYNDGDAYLFQREVRSNN